MQDAASLLVETVNQCGGVLGQPVKLVSADDETKPDRGVAAMTKLTEIDQVDAVVGAAGSAITDAILPIAVNRKVVQISPASTSPIFTEQAKQGKYNGYWYRTAPSDALQGPALAQLAQKNKFRWVAVLAINNDYGNGLAQAFIPAFTATGGTIANAGKPILYSPDATTFDTEVDQAFQDQPDALLLIGYPESGSLILKTAYEKGFLNNKTKILLTDGMKDKNLARLVGKDERGNFLTTGMLGTAPRAEGPGQTAFIQRYQAKYKRIPGIYNANTWDAVALLTLAAERAKSPHGEAIKGQLLTVANGPGQATSDVCQALAMIRQGKPINYQGASSDLTLNASGDVAGSYEVWTFQPDSTIRSLETITITQSP
jgi:branched-chain amino acid transport system substrate-binding protein/neutral amino acid transport system substrate-binding protein